MIRKVPREKRRTGRGKVSVPVSFIAPPETPDTDSEIQSGTTSDVSAYGLGFFAQRELPQGAILEIECSDIWDSPKRFAVRWCNKIALNVYRVGLELQE